MKRNKALTLTRILEKVYLLTLALSASSLLSGCLVAGVSTGGGGWFIWPGGFGFLFVILLLFLLLRRRR